MNRRTHIDDGEKGSLAGVSASPSRSAWADNVIPFPQATNAAALGFEEEAGEPDPFASVGSLAPWQPVGDVVAAVVMRCRDRITVIERSPPEPWEEEESPGGDG
jgi:hypothetical protein